MNIKTPSFSHLGFKVSSKTWQRIVAYYQHTYGGVIPSTFPMEEFAKQRLESSHDQLVRLNSLNLPKVKTFLDAGCGLGQFLVLALKNGYNYYGYEVDREAFEIAQQLLKENNLNPSRAVYADKTLPFGEKKFDVITSFEVAEHVTDLNQYVKNISYMLNKKGMVFIETPNYLLPYEPHFYIFFPPFIPKKIKWLFCKVKGRTNIQFFNELNFVTPYAFSKAFRNAGLTWKNLGVDEWYRQIAIEPAANRSTHVKKLSKILRRYRMEKIVLFLAKAGVYTPQVYLGYFPDKIKYDKST